CQVLIDSDVAAGVRGHASLVQPEVIGVRAATDRQQHVRSDRCGWSFGTINGYGHTSLVSRKPDALRTGPYCDALAFQDASNLVGDILVLTSDQARCHFDDGDPGTEPAVHLPELEADVTAPDDNEMLRDAMQRQ